jgi:8-oxo-dGTP pyrophosphatase MutT (NUDIX family)
MCVLTRASARAHDRSVTSSDGWGSAGSVRYGLLYDGDEMRTDHLRSLLADTLEPDPRSHPRPGEHLAAVLVPIVEDQDPWVVFTRRTDELPRHAGEISFPGGLSHAVDPALRDTALRETEEELGLSPSEVDVLGALPAVHTFVSSILIVPFVGMLRPGPTFAPNAGEIAEVLQYPLVRLADAEREVELPRGDHVYRGFAYEMQDNTIWGATAFILHSLIEIVRKEQS